MSVEENPPGTSQQWDNCRYLACQTDLLRCVKEEKRDENEFLREFYDLGPDVVKMDFLHEHLRRFGLLEDKYIKGEKDDRKGTRHRRKGDNAFAKSEDMKAIDHYSRSLMVAESEEVLAKSYANRSAALFRSKMFEESVEDINRALAHSYPANQVDPLIRRRKHALEFARSHPRKSFYQDPPHLAQNQRHPGIPCASRNIEVRWKTNRRAVYAAKDIRIGDVIAVEEPLAHTIPTADTLHCHHCYELCYNPIPCKICCHVVYCDETCRDEARKRYHQHECGLLQSIKSLAGRYAAFIMLGLKLSCLAEKGELRREEPLMEEMTKDIEREELFCVILIAAVYFDLVKTHTRKFENESEENSFKKLFMKFALRCFVSIGGIDELAPSILPKMGKWRPVKLGFGLFPLFASFRHACNPNLVCHHHGTRKVLRAQRTIEKGRECFVSYGPKYADNDREMRQMSIYTMFYFNCRCRACEEDWFVVRRNEPFFVKNPEAYQVMNRLPKGEIEYAKSKIAFLIERVRNYEHLEPDWNLSVCTKMLTFCYDLIANKRDH